MTDQEEYDRQCAAPDAQDERNAADLCDRILRRSLATRQSVNNNRGRLCGTTDPQNIASWWKSLTTGQRATARRVAMSGSRKLDNDTFDSLVTHGNPMARSPAERAASGG